LNTLASLALLTIGVILIGIDQAFLAALFIIAAIAVFISRFFSKTKKIAKTTGEVLTYGVGEQVEAAEPSGFNKEIAKEGLNSMADIAGHQTFSKSGHQLKFKGIGSLGDASKKMIKLFKKAFNK